MLDGYLKYPLNDTRNCCMDDNADDRWLGSWSFDILQRIFIHFIVNYYRFGTAFISLQGDKQEGAPNAFFVDT